MLYEEEIEMALENLIFGCIWCITIFGIPFGLQFFKIAKLSLIERLKFSHIHKKRVKSDFV